jgi:hypothetical protein
MNLARQHKAESAKSLQFHIQQNDCFGTLATVVDLVAQSLRKQGTSREIAALGRVRDQLMYLQHGYRLEELVPYCPLTVHESRERERPRRTVETE